MVADDAGSFSSEMIAKYFIYLKITSSGMVKKPNQSFEKDGLSSRISMKKSRDVF